MRSRLKKIGRPGSYCKKRGPNPKRRRRRSVDDPRLAYCPLFVLDQGSGRRGGTCPDPRDCSECVHFEAVLTDLGLLEEVQWICPRCLTPGLNPSGWTLLGHYSEEICDDCESPNSLCQAAIHPSRLDPADWRELVRQRAVEELQR